MRSVPVILALALAGCATPPPPPVAPAPPVAAPPEPSPPPADMCKAAEHQHLIGRPRTEIPVPVRPELQRVACDTCPVTLDYLEGRLNFFFSAETGRITRISCG